MFLRQFLVWLILGILVSIKIGFSQTEFSRKSIHQIELDKYRKYQIPKKEEAAPFLGKPMPLKPRNNPPSHEVFGYLPYWVYNTYPNLNYNLLTTIAYFGANIDASGNITNDHDWPAAGLINTAHANGVRVVLTAILFNSDDLDALLSNPARRSNLVNNLLNSVQAAGADGVNIDFEGVRGGQRDNLTAFMTELANTFHNTIPGSFITIFTPAVDWNSAFDYNALAQVTDGLVIQGYDYHWGGGPTAGPNAPLTGTRWGFFNVTWTVNDYLSKTNGNAEKLIQTVPFYGFEWPTMDDGLESQTTGPGTAIFYSVAYPNAQTYGRLWDAESQTPWYKYNDGSWHQGWYDDSLSLALKFEFIKSKNLKGTGIWALSYDGQRLELQGALSDAFGATAPPLKPAALRIQNIGNNDVKVAVQPASGATSYKIYRSADGVQFNNVIVYPSASNILGTLSPDTVYYMKISAVNGNGESNQTEVLGILPNDQPAPILVVNGFDRTSGTNNTMDFIRQFAPAIVNAGFSFDACANEAVQEGYVLLTDYAAVIWISGEEGTADESFSDTEQNIIANYLENGGRMFISGSEIGYDLVEKGSATDKSFYETYLKAMYVRDRVATYSVSPQSGGILDGVGQFSFDNGTHGTYNVDFPDGINPQPGAQLVLSYSGFSPSVYGGAGIQYAGTFGSGLVSGRLVYLAFPFETIYPEAMRNLIMQRVLNFLMDGVVGVQLRETDFLPGTIELAQNYPNPFNPSTSIQFSLNYSGVQLVQLKIYNIFGEEVKTLLSSDLPAGTYNVVWDGTNNQQQPVASGIYLYQLVAAKQRITHKMTLLK
jgi:spore germination protein YaaH